MCSESTTIQEPNMILTAESFRTTSQKNNTDKTNDVNKWKVVIKQAPLPMYLPNKLPLKKPNKGNKIIIGSINRESKNLKCFVLKF
jgi:hypothetical protein